MKIGPDRPVVEVVPGGPGRGRPGPRAPGAAILIETVASPSAIGLHAMPAKGSGGGDFPTAESMTTAPRPPTGPGQAALASIRLAETVPPATANGRDGRRPLSRRVPAIRQTESSVIGERGRSVGARRPRHLSRAVGDRDHPVEFAGVSTPAAWSRPHGPSRRSRWHSPRFPGQAKESLRGEPEPRFWTELRAEAPLVMGRGWPYQKEGTYDQTPVEDFPLLGDRRGGGAGNGAERLRKQQR